ncbi:MAG: hypothetical protein E7559_01970 [Ruminococcaceae bacterium]|nr:hypothetical protein [Oscillospiraceae bacterium]
MKKTIILLLTLLLIAALSGCVKQENTSPETPTATNAPAVQVIGELHTAEAAKIGDRTFTRIHTFGEDEYESYYVWHDNDMDAVKLYSVEYSIDDDCAYNCGVIYELERLPAGEGLLLNIMVPEGFPNTMLSYDIGGQHYDWLLGYNGRDGGISFIEQSGGLPYAPTQPTETTTTTQATEPQGVMFSIYLMDDNAEHLLCREMTIESDSAWHAWAALKQLNPCIPAKAYLNSFTLNGADGTLDLNDGIYAAQLGSGPEALMLQAIANTFIENYNLERLYITVDGSTYESGHAILDEPFTYMPC